MSEKQIPLSLSAAIHSAQLQIESRGFGFKKIQELYNVSVGEFKGFECEDLFMYSVKNPGNAAKRRGDGARVQASGRRERMGE